MKKIKKGFPANNIMKFIKVLFKIIIEIMNLMINNTRN